MEFRNPVTRDTSKEFQEFLRGRLRMTRAKGFSKGDGYRVVEPFLGEVMTQWRGPYTGGYTRLLPAGLEFVVLLDPPDEATAVTARVVADEHWEEILVSPEDRAKLSYDGYYLVIPFAEMEAHCAPLEERSQ
jgi:hypothetical protein